MILIYSEEITPRVEYIFHLIFTQILRVEISFTTNSADFRNSTEAKLNYSFEKFGNELYIKPHDLLYNKALVFPTIQEVCYNDEKYFFESSEDSFLPFDPFAASFFLVSRYEEYLETEFDNFGRYQANKSILAKYNLLKKPVVNIWANLLADKIKLVYPDLIIQKRKFEFLSTIDVDNAWAYLHKGFWRSGGAILKCVLKRNFTELKTRITVLSGAKKDPYDTYEYLDTVLKKDSKRVKFFLLIGDYARLDKNISYKNRHFKELIKNISLIYDIGIHPSFLSGNKGGFNKVKKEKSRLESITKKNIQKSRQHFLKLRFPKTYRRLIKAGITEDYSMGYSSQTGFRAGTCTPYYFYDLKKEATTNLKIFPFQIMDVTLRDYLGLSPSEAQNEIMKLMREVKNVGGTFIGIWHNETVTDLDRWKGFRQVFEEMNKTGFEWANE